MCRIVCPTRDFVSIAESSNTIGFGPYDNGVVFTTVVYFRTYFIRIGSLFYPNEKNRTMIATCKNATNRTLFMFGDQLTIEHIEKVEEIVEKKCIEEDQPMKYARIKEVMNTMKRITGDLHMNFAIICAILKFGYGGFLQPIQAALGWKRIGMDATKASKHQTIGQIHI